MPVIAPTRFSPMSYRTTRGALRAGLLVGLAALTSLTAIATESGAGIAQAAGVDSNDWLGVINTYRSQSGLAPVTENGAWASGTTNHSCWMLLNGIAHDEAPGTAGYTADGDQAGNSGNVAVSSSTSSTPRSNIDLWMSGPFHAIGILRPTLTQTSYGQCSSPPNPSTTQWKSAGTLDVIRGNNWSGAKPTTPVVFPGPGATTSLTRFVAESPDPRTYCNWSGRTVGLPLIALMPAGVSSATAVLNGPNGPVTTCVLTGSNTDGVASSILGGENAVVVVPDSPLTTGTYSVSVNSNGGAANWSFKVDPNASLAPTVVPQANTTVLGSPAQFQSVTPFRFADSRVGQTITRLAAGQQVRIQVGGQQGIPANVTAVSANFTVAEPTGPGYLTAFNCGGSVPDVSTLNYGPGEAVANQAVVPLTNGALCVYAYTDAHLIIDVNGYVSTSSTSRFVPTDPKRLFDTRFSAPVQAGATLRVVVEGNGSPAPLGSDAVALNLTMADTAGEGWIRAFPCDAAEPGVSSVNSRAGGVRANSVIVPTAADGSICVTASVTTHVIVDITGWFGRSSGLSFVPLAPIRLADTRSYQPDLNPAANAQPLLPGSILRVPVAGIRGVPANARAATVNLVALDAPVGGWLRVVPCGTSSDVSNLNYQDAAPVANGANVKLSADGAICLTTFQPAHVIVDVTGVWL
jgi:Cysteine-rich secretory protein family